MAVYKGTADPYFYERKLKNLSDLLFNVRKFQEQKKLKREAYELEELVPIAEQRIADYATQPDKLGDPEIRQEILKPFRTDQAKEKMLATIEAIQNDPTGMKQLAAQMKVDQAKATEALMQGMSTAFEMRAQGMGFPMQQSDGMQTWVEQVPIPDNPLDVKNMVLQTLPPEYQTILTAGMDRDKLRDSLGFDVPLAPHEQTATERAIAGSSDPKKAREIAVGLDLSVPQQESAYRQTVSQEQAERRLGISEQAEQRRGRQARETLSDRRSRASDKKYTRKRNEVKKALEDIVDTVDDKERKRAATKLISDLDNLVARAQQRPELEDRAAALDFVKGYLFKELSKLAEGDAAFKF